MTNLYKEMNNVVDETDERHIEPLSEEEKHKLKTQFNALNKKVKHHKQKWLPAAVAAAVLTLSSIPLLNDDVQAGVENILDKITFSLANDITPTAAKYAEHINETITLGKINVKVTDVIVEKEFITLNILYDLPADAELVGQDVTLSANHARGDTYFGSIGIIDKKNNVYSQSETIKLNTPLEQNNVDIKININNIQYRLNEKSMTEKKKATYQFDVNRKKLTKATKRYVFNKKHHVQHIPVTLKDITINPVTARMNITFGKIKQVNTMLIDEKGKRYVFTPKIVYHKVTVTDLMLTLDDYQSDGSIDELNKAKHLNMYFLNDATDQMNPNEDEALNITLK